MDVAKTDIAELAELLENRKNNRKFALILGSRTGALFRNQDFAEEIASLSAHSFSSFSDMKATEQFSKCYSLLKEYKGQNPDPDTKIFLDQQIKNIEFSIADECMAELVEQRFFRVILSFNPDDILYNAFTTRLKENDHFVKFDFDHLLSSIKDMTVVNDHISKIFHHQKRQACKVVKIYKDTATLIYSLREPEMPMGFSACVKEFLKEMKINEVLIVGMDLAWDHTILSALPPTIETVWFVNEDEQVKETFRTTYERVQKFRFITGVQGEYEKILVALQMQINPGRPPQRDELTKQLQHQLNLIQQDLKSVKAESEKLMEHVKHMRTQITTLTRRVEDVINTYNNGEEK